MHCTFCCVGSYVVNKRILSNNMKSLSPNCYMTFWRMTIFIEILHWSDIALNCELVTDVYLNLTFSPIAWGFHGTFVTGVACQKKTLFLGYLILYHFGTCLCSNIETTSHGHVLFRECEFWWSLGASFFIRHTNVGHPWIKTFGSLGTWQYLTSAHQ